MKYNLLPFFSWKHLTIKLMIQPFHMSVVHINMTFVLMVISICKFVFLYFFVSSMNFVLHFLCQSYKKQGLFWMSELEKETNVEEAR
ncbi:putative UDP-N-acetylglucosamine--peptide N-acetylglucosaminyltransferase SEC [Iris pallida]|uniref:UDP-N-acetylglucosamine--peptide N-acetylglucosaminyltransferase SEC n=1 Tax=Iris pallida TaxID=29817 RepID=A0AAX6HX24_IRIPA|nr:putative UDP-N-acetylglucosamine--peptide N-acetylglucosaminyltransferase SEC [Iris pallida]